MKLIRYNYPELAFGGGLRRLLSDAFDGLHRPFGSFFEGSGLGPRSLRADLYAADGAYHARLELPGVKKEDVSVSLENAVLTVKAEYKNEANDETTSLSRSLAVPEDTNAEAISAKLENGVLDVTLPKAEVKKPTAIEIE